MEQYWTDLGPACYQGDSTYEERKDARTKEIGALKDAERILGEAFNEKPAAEDEASGFLIQKNNVKFMAVRRH